MALLSLEDGRGEVIRNGDLLELLEVRLGAGDYLFKHHGHQIVNVVWEKKFQRKYVNNVTSAWNNGIVFHTQR